MPNKKRQYKKSSQLSSKELREFRSLVSKYKKAGLIKGKVDARSARPSFVRGGKSLAAQVNAAQKIKTVKQAKTTPKLAPLDKPVSFRNLPSVNKKSLAGVLNSIEENADAINATKKQEENFGFKIYGSKSYRVFEDVRDLIKYLEKYKTINEVQHKRLESDDVLSNLVLVRVNKTANQWKPEKQKFTKTKLEQHRKKLHATRKRINQVALRKRRK